MPKLNDTKLGREIGLSSPTQRFIWSACEKCGKERWVRYSKGQVRSKRCKKCRIISAEGRNRINQSINRMEKHYRWNGGRIRDTRGYILIRLSPTDAYFPMVQLGNYVLEHRLVMAKHLNRCLLKWEVVHHINGIKDDNRIENLELHNCQGEHNTRMEQILKEQTNEIKKLKEKIAMLEAENKHYRSTAWDISILEGIKA